MNKYGTLAFKISTRIARKKNLAVFLREDFSDLGGYNQIGRVLADLVRQEQLVKIGYGLYAKTQVSIISGRRVPLQSLPDLAREAIKRLGKETNLSWWQRSYQDGKSTQVPTGRVVGVKGRISRKIGYRGNYVSYEYLS